MRRISLCVAIAALLIGATPALSVEYGMGLWPPGYAGFMAGVLPPHSGFYLTGENYYFGGTADRELRNGLIELDADVQMDIGFLDGTYVSDLHFLDATYAAGALFSYAGMNLTATLETPIGSLHESVGNSGLGDTILTPVILGWNEGNFHWLLAENIYTPTGSFQLHQLNIGRNVWAGIPQFSLTYFDPQTGLDLSGTLAYVVQSENGATNYQSGDVLNFDWALGLHVSQECEVGVQGNVVQQVTGDSGSGARLGPFEAQSAGIGPGVSFSTLIGAIPASFGAKWERDFDAHNTFKGDVVTASATFVF